MPCAPLRRVRLCCERAHFIVRKKSMTEYQIASLAVPLFVGLVQCGLIGWGLWMMSISTKSREANNAALLGMGAALQSQSAILADIGATLQSQSAVLADIGAGIREQSAGLREQSAGIREKCRHSRTECRHSSVTGAICELTHTERSIRLRQYSLGAHRGFSFCARSACWHQASI